MLNSKVSTARRLGPWLVGAALFGGAWWLVSATDEKRPGQPRQQPASALNEAEAKAGGLGLGGVVVAEAHRDFWEGRYALTFTAELSGTGATGMRQEGRLELDAAVEIARAPALGDDWYAGRLVETRVLASANMRGPYGLDTSEPGRGLDGAFVFQVGERGAVTERRFEAGLPAVGRLVASALTGGFQVRRPDAAVPKPDDSAPWEVTELGLTRPIAVTYTPDVRRGLTKEWRVPAPGRDSVTEGGSRGFASLQLADGQLQSGHWTLTAETDLAAALGGPSAQAAVFKSSTALEIARKGDTPFDPELWIDALRLEALETTIEPARVSSAEPRQPGPARTVDALITAAAEAEAAEDNTTRRQAMSELARHAELDDAVVDRLTDTLRAGAPPELERTLIEALVSARSAHADVVLAGLLADAAAPTRVRKSVATASTFTRPGPSLRGSLSEAAAAPVNDMSTAALWAMAGQSRLLRDTDPALAGQLADEVMALATPRLAELASGPDGPDAATEALSGTTRAELKHWLEAVGAVGGADAWPVVEPWLDHADPWVRRYAVGAARFVPTAEARMAIVTAMGNDRDPNVRRAAIDSAAWQPQAAMEAAVLRALETDQQGIVQLAAAHQVSVWSTGSPSLLDNLRRVAARETREDLKKLLVGFLPDGVVSRAAPPGSSTAPAGQPAAPGGRP